MPKKLFLVVSIFYLIASNGRAHDESPPRSKKIKLIIGCSLENTVFWISFSDSFEILSTQGPTCRYDDRLYLNVQKCDINTQAVQEFAFDNYRKTCVKLEGGCVGPRIGYGSGKPCIDDCWHKMTKKTKDDYRNKRNNPKLIQKYVFKNFEFKDTDDEESIIKRYS